MPRQVFLGVSLLLLLLALSTTVRADAYQVVGSFDQVGQTYNAYTVNLTTIDQATTGAVTVVLQDGTVSGSGLDIYGFRTDPVSVSKTLDMRILSAVVSDATITFEGFMPHASIIQVNNTLATMQSNKPVFNLDFLDLSYQTLFTMFSTTARWTGSQRGWVVSMQSGTALNNIRMNSALFIMGVVAQSAMGVFATDSTGSLTVDTFSVLAIDYASCIGCTTGLFSLSSPTNVQGGSMLRISHCNETDGSMIGFHSTVAITQNSLLLVSDNLVTSGTLFSQLGGTLSATTGARTTFRNIQTPDTGLSSAQPIPTLSSPATSLGGSVVVAGATLQAITDFATRGITITTLLTSDGYSSGTTTCASAACIPAGTSAVTSSAAPCSCTCSNGYNDPDCTTMHDPIVLFQLSHNNDCYVANCLICNPADPTKCTKCASGYTLKDNMCVRSSGCGCGACGITGCAFCRWYPTKYCIYCNAGYRRDGPQQCTSLISGADSRHTAPLALTMLLLSAVAAQAM